MNKKFEELVGQMPVLLERLRSSPLKLSRSLGELPKSGIYVFFERGRAIYVGRSRRMKDRIKEHGRPSSTHGSAPFAFNMAKKAAERKGIDTDKPRDALAENDAFAKLFSDAKERVSKMSVRVIEVNDSIEQTLFEVYAAIDLETTEYNDFDTH